MWKIRPVRHYSNHIILPKIALIVVLQGNQTQSGKKKPVILKPCSTLFSIYPGLFTARWNEFLKRTIWDTDETRQVWRGVFIWIKANHQMISSKKVTRSDLWEHQSNISPPPVVSNIALLIWVTRIINTPATKCEASFSFSMKFLFFCFVFPSILVWRKRETKLNWTMVCN